MFVGRKTICKEMMEMVDAEQMEKATFQVYQ